MNIDIVRHSIRNWNEIRHTQLGLKFLTSGSGFEIKRSEYIKWEEIKNKATEEREKTYVHLYIGVLEFETVFYLIDSISDKGRNYIIDETLFYKSFTKENKEEGVRNKGVKEVVIEDKEAAARAFKWFFYSDEWAREKLNGSPKNDESGIVRVFTIPFEDFENVFHDNNNDKAYLFFGITNMNREGESVEDEIEVILCSEKGFLDKKSLNEAEDVTTPRPPYSIVGQGLNLLQ